MKAICSRFAVVLVLLPGIALRAQTPSVFEAKAERLQGPPLWISAQAVADEKSIINLDLLDSYALRDHVERQSRLLPSREPYEKSFPGGKPAIVSILPSVCKHSQYSSGHGHRGGRGPTSTLSDLMAGSLSIQRGTIRTVDLGFDGGVPGSLLGVEVSATIKGPAPASPFYVLYPVAHFRIGPLQFCNTREGFEPHPGDQILLFDFTGPVDRDDVVFAPRLSQIIFQRADGTLYLPTQLKSAPASESLRTLDEVVRRLSTVSSSPQGGAR